MMVVALLAYLAFERVAYTDSNVEITYVNDGDKEFINFECPKNADSIVINKVHFKTSCVAGTLEENASVTFQGKDFNFFALDKDSKKSNAIFTAETRGSLYYACRNGESCETPSFIEIYATVFEKSKTQQEIFRQGVWKIKFLEI